jgi:tRNA-(ms[2]io[6]A)-hydroxylase
LLTLSPTRSEWLDCALSDFNATLCDHFHCERKAATSALALVRYYSRDANLVAAMAKLAHEETRHMLQVAARLSERGVPLARDRGDTYASGLRKAVRHSEPVRQLDLLLVSALIEARSAERLRLLASALAPRDPALARFYSTLFRAEEGHHELFLELARPLVAPAELARRLAELCAREAEVVAGLPLEPRIH